MDNALETLFHPFETGALTRPGAAQGADHAWAFLNARLHPRLSEPGFENCYFQQYFRPYAQELQGQGFTVASDFRPGQTTPHDLVLILLPKNVIEARGLIARGLGLLKPGGLIAVAADNKAGGGRIGDMLQHFGLSDIYEASKNKARVGWAVKGKIDAAAITAALAAAELQPVLNGEYMSMPGLFGWDKIDQGSKLLLQSLDGELQGAGADFGCGYGYLARNVLQHYKGVKALSCIDADYRAIRAAQENMKNINAAADIRYFWEDLTQPQTGTRDLDFVIMNPPFHEGKSTDASIGAAFIKMAAESLRHDGKLWLVANAGLPYERVILKHFRSCSKKFEGEGFKVYAAAK